MANNNNKYEVTATFGYKLLAWIILVGASFKAASEDSAAAFLTLFIYSFLYIGLAVGGSNNKVASWLVNQKFFLYICFGPTLIWAFYCGATLGDDKSVMAVFSVLLTIFSIPFAFLLIKFRAGIRKFQDLAAFLLFPVILRWVSEEFAEKALSTAISASLFTVLICFLIAYFDYSRDHKTDYTSADDKDEAGRYTATWKSHPQSEVRNQVIHLRGTIVVNYTGEFFQPSADKVVRNLIQRYVMRVGNEMKGYSVNDAEVYVEYRKLD